MTETRYPIAPPPSLDAILAATAERIGAVDFTAPVVREPEPAPVAVEPEPVTVEPVAVEPVAVEPEPVAAERDPEPEPEPDPHPVPSAPELVVTRPVGDLVDELRQLSLGVEDVASQAIARMRATEEAARLHVAAMEAEAARRCELLMAQAELDAELIRLHARREAHAIIAAARARTGEPDRVTVESLRLGEIGEAATRFAQLAEDPPEVR